MKKGLFVGFLCGLGMVSALWATGAREKLFSNPEYRHEGDDTGREVFNVQCSSQAWTSVVLTDEDSRSVIFGAIVDNAGADVCLSSIPTTSHPCDSSTAGVHIAPGGAYTDYSTGYWNCRSRATFVDRLAGARFTHSLD